MKKLKFKSDIFKLSHKSVFYIFFYISFVINFFHAYKNVLKIYQLNIVKKIKNEYKRRYQNLEIYQNLSKEEKSECYKNLSEYEKQKFVSCRKKYYGVRKILFIVIIRNICFKK